MFNEKADQAQVAKRPKLPGGIPAPSVSFVCLEPKPSLISNWQPIISLRNWQQATGKWQLTKSIQVHIC
jgi:hypothetical protein